MEELLIELKKNRLENGITRSLVDGATALSEDGLTYVYNHDGVVVQKLEIVDGNRVPHITSHDFTITGSEVSLSTVALLQIDQSGNQTFIRELLQKGVL